MIAGVVTLAVIVFALRHSGQLGPTLPAERLSTLRVLTWAAAGGAGLVLVILRLRLASSGTAARPAPTIIAWAIGEFAALFGIVFVMVSGVESAAAPGLLAFATAMVLFPAPRGD